VATQGKKFVSSLYLIPWIHLVFLSHVEPKNSGKVLND